MPRATLLYFTVNFTNYYISKLHVWFKRQFRQYLKNSNACRFLYSYALNWYEARRLKKLFRDQILYRSVDPLIKNGVNQEKIHRHPNHRPDWLIGSHDSPLSRDWPNYRDLPPPKCQVFAELNFCRVFKNISGALKQKTVKKICVKILEKKMKKYF